MNFICGKSTRLAIALSIAIGTWQSANAVGLGPISVDSHIGEPLSAYINVNGISSSEASNASITLASNDAYQVRGIKKLASHDRLHFSLSPSPSGTGYIIKVSSTQRIREPFINFLLDMKVGGKDIIREYAVFLEPGVGGLSTGSLPPVAPIDSASEPMPVTADVPKSTPPMPTMNVEPAAPSLTPPSVAQMPIAPLPIPPVQADIAANKTPAQQPVLTPEVVVNNTPAPIKPLPSAEIPATEIVQPVTQSQSIVDISADITPPISPVSSNTQPPLPTSDAPPLAQTSLPIPAQPAESLPVTAEPINNMTESAPPVPLARPRLKGPRLLAVKPASRKKAGWQGRSALPVADNQSDIQPEVINVSISSAPQPATANELSVTELVEPTTKLSTKDLSEELPPDAVSPRVMNPAEFLDLPPSAVVGEQPQELAPLENDVSDQSMPASVQTVPKTQSRSSRSTSASVPLSGRTYGPIKPGETLFSIAEKFRPSDNYPLKSVMRDIYQANRSAFSSSDLSSLLAGVTLQIPIFDGHLPAASYPEKRTSNVSQVPQRPRATPSVTREPVQQTAPAARAPRTQVRQVQPVAEESKSEPETDSSNDELHGRPVADNVNTSQVIEAKDEVTATTTAHVVDSMSHNDDAERVALLNAEPMNDVINADTSMGSATSNIDMGSAHDVVPVASQDNLAVSANTRSPLFVEDTNNTADTSNTMAIAGDAVQAANSVENSSVQPAGVANAPLTQTEVAQSAPEESAELETVEENQEQEKKIEQQDEESNIFERFFFSTYALLPNWQWLAIGLGVIVLLAFLLYRRSRSRTDVDDGALDQQEMEAVLARINALDGDEHHSNSDASVAQTSEASAEDTHSYQESSETTPVTSSEELLDNAVPLPHQHEDSGLAQEQDVQSGIQVPNAASEADDVFARAAMLSLDKTEAKEVDNQQKQWPNNNIDERHDSHAEVSAFEKQSNSETSLNDGETMSDDNNPIDDFDFLDLGGEGKKISSKQNQSHDNGAQDESDNIDFLNSSLDEDFYEMEVEERKKTVQKQQPEDEDENDIIDATVSEDQSWMDELVFESDNKQPKKSSSTAQQKPAQQKSSVKLQPVSNVSPEEMEINLDLAASFIATGHGERALSWLEEVLEVGTTDQKARAKEMLAQISKK